MDRSGLWANTVITGYWWRGRSNFGDLLTPLLVARFAGVQLAWAPPAEAGCAVVGSVLEHLPLGWTGMVAGAGKLFEDSYLDLHAATVLGVRGPLSARGLRKDIVLGDPGLLASDLVRPTDKRYNLGIVPHWSDRGLEHRPEFARWDPHIIRCDDNPLNVIQEISYCKKIVSSSLHGIIVADAFNIPRRTEIAPAMDREGGTFKFRDYNASINTKFMVGTTQAADHFAITNRQAELYDMLEDLGRRLTGKRRPA